MEQEGPARIGELYRDKENSVRPDGTMWAGRMDGWNLEAPQTNHSFKMLPTCTRWPHEGVAAEKELENRPGCLGSEAQTEFSPEATTGLQNHSLLTSS